MLTTGSVLSVPNILSEGWCELLPSSVQLTVQFWFSDIDVDTDEKVVVVPFMDVELVTMIVEFMKSEQLKRLD